MVIATFILAIVAALFATVALLGVVALYDQSDSHMSHFNRRMNMFADRLASHSNRIARNAGDLHTFDSRYAVLERRASDADRQIRRQDEDLRVVLNSVNGNFREAQSKIQLLLNKVFPPKKPTKRELAKIRKTERLRLKAAKANGYTTVAA